MRMMRLFLASFLATTSCYAGTSYMLVTCSMDITAGAAYTDPNNNNKLVMTNNCISAIANVPSGYTLISTSTGSNTNYLFSK